jgi:hypothetical protein
MQNYERRLVDSSRMIADIIVAEIDSDQDKFDEILMLALRDEYPLSMRAARILVLSGFKNRNLLKPHILLLINALSSAKVDGLKRSILKIFAELPLQLDDETIGKLTEISFNLISDRNQSIATRAFAIGILTKVIKKFPDIKFELKAVLESIMLDGSVGLKKKCSKTLKLIR